MGRSCGGVGVERREQLAGSVERRGEEDGVEGLGAVVFAGGGSVDGPGRSVKAHVELC